jgi:hypothetical protein
LSTSDIWEDDLLDREKDASFLQKLLLAKSKEKETNPDSPAYVLNIDQSWGAGKTFFLKRFEQQLREEAGYATCYINAWEDDFSEDPMIPIISAIDQQLLSANARDSDASKHWKDAKSHVVTFAKVFTKHAAMGALKKFTGVHLAELTDELEHSDTIAKTGEDSTEIAAEHLLESFRGKKKHLNDFKEAFAAAIKALSNSGSKSPLFVLIDELDRCKPTYAIAVLERIKHLFSVNGVVFVLATDKEQLSHSISAVYGENFDGARYLNRFFDSTYHFPEPSTASFVDFVIHSKGIELHKLCAPLGTETSEFIVNCMKSYALSLRDIEQCLSTLEIITTLWSHKSGIQLIYLLPLIICHQQSRREEFSCLANREHERWANTTFPNSNSLQPIDIHFEEHDDFGRFVKRHSVPLRNLLSNFMRYSFNSLDQLPNLNPSSGPTNKWLYRTFSREHSLDHGSEVTLNRTLKSIVCEYPDYVKSAQLLDSGT